MPRARGGAAWAAPAALAAAFALAFWPGLVALGGAWATPEYSHGPLIPLISLWLFLRELRDRPAPADPAPDRRAGIALLLGALALAALGQAARIPDVVAYATIPWAMGLVLMAMGWRRGRRHWASVLHLAFMIPLPQVLYWQASVGLQTVSAEMGVWMLRLVGVPVWLEGHVIDLGVWKLEVAEACSGLRYLFPILSFSYLMGIVYRGPMAHRLLLVAAAAPLAVVLNAARIAMIGVLVDRHGIERAQGAMHWIEGWVVFGACVGLLWGMAALLHRTVPARRRAPEMLDLDCTGLAARLAEAPVAAATRGALAAAALTALVAVALAAMPPLARPAPERLDFAAFPLRLDGWTGRRGSLAPEIERALGATDYLEATYAAPGEAAPVALFTAWYASQVDGAGLHSPEVCLPAGGWEIAGFEEVDIGFPANRAVIRRDGAEQLVLYWFEQRGRRMTDDRLAKLTVLRDAVLRGRSDGALVRLTTPIAPGESVADAQTRLRRVLAPALARMPAFVPG
nr:VPLPA-CTERM-specific exosortase XrtD [Jannaschia sp. Os4]